MSLAAPLLFDSHLRPMVWGGRSLESRLGKQLPTSERYGESWEVSDHALHHSVVAVGPQRGRTLRHLMTEHAADLLGPAAARHSTFPWLIKFLDAHDWLSVQVHPDADTVRLLRPGEGSKTEAWIILEAAPESRVYAGLAPGIGPAELRQALSEGRVDRCLHSFLPRPGDCVFLPAGTVHAVGGGVLFAEIQETSDATFRLFDWNRVDAQGNARALHIDERFAAIHWERGPVQPVRHTGAARQPLVRCWQFALDSLRIERPMDLAGVGRLQALIVLDGAGSWPDGTRVTAGQAWLLPAALPSVRLTPALPMTTVLALLP